MAQLSIDELVPKMITAASNSLGDKWLPISELATTSIKSLAQNFVDIEQLKLNRTITDEQAKMIISMQQNTLKMVLLSEEGLGLLAAEGAINAVIDVIRDAVNAAIGIIII